MKKILFIDRDGTLIYDAKIIYDQLLGRGIMVQDCSDMILCEGCLRITVGTMEENKRLIDVMSGI